MTIRIFLRNLVYSNFFIALCAVMMAWETQQVFYIPQKEVLLFICFATFCSYSFHSLLNTIYPATTNRHEWNVRNKSFLITMFIISTIIVFVYTWKLRSGLLYIGFAALTTFLYSAPVLPFKPFVYLRRIAIGKTIFLALVWTYVTGLMPMLLSQISFGAPHFYYLGSRLFLVYAICILFDIRDREEDREKNIKALPTILSGRSIMRIYYLSLLLSLLSTIMMLLSGMPVYLFICMLVPIIICIFIYFHSIARKDEMYYFVILDGLMMLSAILLFVYLISITFVPGKFQ